MRTLALLRGINVGGHTVKMERLRAIFAELGLQNVRTYIQSGNVFFDAPEDDAAALAPSIEQHLLRTLGYEVPVFLRTVPELERIVVLNPFAQLDVTPEMRLCVAFVDAVPDSLAVPWRSAKGDMEIVHATEREAYMIWHLKDGRPPASQGMNVLGARNTTRFYHTVAKMLAAAGTP